MPPLRSPGVYPGKVEVRSGPIEGVATAVAAFIGVAADGPFHQPTPVTGWNQFTQVFGGFVAGFHLAHAVYGFFMNGGERCYVIRVGGRRGQERERAGAPLWGWEVLARDPTIGSEELAVEVSSPGADGQFTLVVRRHGREVDRLERLSANGGPRPAVDVVNRDSQAVWLRETERSHELGPPVRMRVNLSRPAPGPPRRLRPAELIGSPAERTGLGGLEEVDEVTMVAVPDLMAAYPDGSPGPREIEAVQHAVIDHCERLRDRMAILDVPPGLDADQARRWRTRTGHDSPYACLYWPWIRVFDPATRATVAVPPSGHVAGVWSRSDASAGVHRAPANEEVHGTSRLDTGAISRLDQELLNPAGVNCLRAFPGRGIRVFGARTLSSDPAWRYLNVRRLLNYLRESILAGTQWAVFEPNDSSLWSRLERTATAFLLAEWRHGALLGAAPEEAFYVRCDRSTNAAQLLDLGTVTCEVGVALVKPSEFVVFRLSQSSGGTTLISE
jgi:hypothetical protein